MNVLLESDILISIKPEYTLKIMNGEKKVEFRKKFTTNFDNFTKFYIYCSNPIKKIVGYFIVTRIEWIHPKCLWEKYKTIGGIDEKRFFEYFQNREIGFALVIHKFYKLEEYFNPYLGFEHFTAPQSYYFLNKERMKILEGLKIE